MGEMEYSADGSLAKLAMISKTSDGFYIIVEDSKKEYVYEQIFKQLFDKKFLFLGIGGKQNIIKNYDEIKHYLKNKMFLCIMDGDFDRYIYPDDLLIDNNVLYLKTYNIENYLINECAFRDFVKGKVKLTDNDLDKCYNFVEWINYIIQESKELFLCYCFIKKNIPEERSVSISASRFFNDKNGIVKKDQIYNFVNSIKEKKGEDYFTSEVQQINERYMSISNRKDYFDFICGKFLMNTLMYRIKGIRNTNISVEDLIWWLVNRIDKNNFVDIIDKVDKISANCEYKN